MRSVLGQASAEAARGDYAAAEVSYERVRSVLATPNPDDDAETAVMHAEASGGLTWLAHRTKPDSAKNLATKTRTLAGTAIDKCLSTSAHPGLLARARQLRAQMRLELGDPIGAVDDLSGIDRGHGLVAATHAVREAGLVLPPHCARCGRTGGAAPAIFNGPNASLCSLCVDEVAPDAVALPIRATCAFCTRMGRAVGPSLSVCRPCLEEMQVLVQPARRGCLECGADADVLCERCVCRFSEELGPRTRARRRSGEPRVHPVRCAECGRNHARAFVTTTSEHVLCDVCIDHLEATLDGAPLSDERAVGTQLTAEEYEVLAELRPDLRAEIVIAGGAVDFDEDAPDGATALALANRCLDAADYEGTIAAARRATALGRKGIELEVEATLRHATSFVKKKDPRTAIDLIGQALASIAASPVGASSYWRARVWRRLGDVQSDLNSSAARASFGRAIYLLENTDDSRAPLELGAAVTNFANLLFAVEPTLAAGYYARGADLFESEMVASRSAASDFTIALENRSLIATKRGDHAAAVADLRRAYDGAIGASEIHEGLDERVRGLEKTLLGALEKARLWQDVVDLAGAAATRLEENGEDAKALWKQRNNGLVQLRGKDAPLPVFCSACQSAPHEVEAIVRGRNANLCAGCIEDGERSEPDPDADCGMCGTTPIVGGFALEGISVCEACALLLEPRIGELESAKEKFGWISPDVLQLMCSFCTKTQREVKKLIAGPKVYICDECVGLCNDILAEKPFDPNAPETVFSGGKTCSFCAKNTGHKLIAGRESAICDDCVGLCNDIIAEEVEKEG